MVYVFYRGDDVQFVGTAEECSSHFGINIRSIRWHASPTARRRADKDENTKRLYAEKVEV